MIEDLSQTPFEHQFVPVGGGRYAEVLRSWITGRVRDQHIRVSIDLYPHDMDAAGDHLAELIANKQEAAMASLEDLAKRLADGEPVVESGS